MAAEEPAGVRPEDMRAGDADREQVLERLRAAHAEGRLDAAELGERIADTLAARTYGELAGPVADLPGEPPSPRPLAPPAASPAAAASTAASGPPAERERSDVDLHRGAAAWAWISVVAIGVWAVVCITSGTFFFPWWIWVAAPWGLGLLWAWHRQRRD